MVLKMELNHLMEQSAWYYLWRFYGNDLVGPSSSLVPCLSSLCKGTRACHAGEALLYALSHKMATRPLASAQAGQIFGKLQDAKLIGLSLIRDGFWEVWCLLKGFMLCKIGLKRTKPNKESLSLFYCGICLPLVIFLPAPVFVCTDKCPCINKLMRHLVYPYKASPCSFH